MYNDFEVIFCGYVDDLSHLYTNEQIDFEFVNERFNFNYPDNTYSHILVEELNKKLKELLQEGTNDLPVQRLMRLGNHLVLKHLINGTEIDLYLLILQQIQYRVDNSFIVAITNKQKWMEIIETIIYIIKVSQQQNLTIYQRDYKSYTNEYQTGKSVQLLMKKGYKFGVTENSIEFLDNSYLKIAIEIESIVVELGGLNVLEEVFKKMSEHYSTKYNRFFLLRKTTGPMGNNNVEPEVPWGYLIGLCTKNLYRRNYPKCKNRNEENQQLMYIEEKLTELFKLSRAYISALKIQDYTPYQHMFLDVVELPLYIRNNVLFDNSVYFNQWNPSFIPDLLDGLLGEFFELEIIRSEIPFTIEEYIQTVNEILRNSNPYGVTTITKSTVQQNTNISNESINNIFRVISKNRKRINKNFLVPHDKNEVFLIPLIEFTSEKYILINPSINSFSFFDCLAQSLRTHIKNFDSTLGIKLEKYLKRKLNQKNINFEFGYYSDNEECDLLVEGDQDLLFFEVKKKALTQESISGNDVKIFEDLSKSLIATQQQLGKHEIYLLINGEVELRENRSNRKGKKGTTKFIKHNSRVINKISVSLNEFGFFSDRVAFTNILKNVIQGDVKSKDDEKDSQLDKLREYIIELREQTIKLQQINPDSKPFFYSSFYSLQQLLTVINESDSKEEFIRRLKSTQHISMGTCNFYYEYDYMKNIINSSSF